MSLDDEAENLEAICELIIARHQTDTESVLNTVALASMNNEYWRVRLESWKEVTSKIQQLLPVMRRTFKSLEALPVVCSTKFCEQCSVTIDEVAYWVGSGSFGVVSVSSWGRVGSGLLSGRIGSGSGPNLPGASRPRTLHPPLFP